MADNFPPTRQRGELDRLAVALNSSPSALRRDECGDPRIKGSRGHVYASPGGFQFYHAATSKQAWTWAKKGLSFAKISQDGEEDGILFLERLPTETEAESLRSYLGIRKRIDLSVEEGARRRENGARLARNRHLALRAADGAQ